MPVLILLGRHLQNSPSPARDSATAQHCASANQERPLRVLYHHRIASSDGQLTHIDEMVSALRVLGVEVCVVGPEVHKSDKGRGGSAGWVGVLKAVLPSALYEIAELAYALAVYLRLRRAVTRFRPDAIYERYALYQPAGVWASRRLRVPLLLEVNAPYAIARRKYNSLRLGWLADLCEKYTFKGATRIFPVTHVLGDMLVDMGVLCQNVAVIPNGIDPKNFEGLPSTDQAKAKLGLAGCTVIGFIGFVREWDRLDQIIDWLARRPEHDKVVLFVVGDGPVRRELEAHALRLRVADKLRFTGVLPRTKVPATAMAFDIALQTALVPYASPLCLFEYMALGKAIVAPDQANHHEVLQRGIDCEMYQPDQPGTLQTTLDVLVDDPARRNRLGAAARTSLAQRKFHWIGNAERVAAVVRELRLAG